MRHKKTGDRGLVAVGIGWALKNGRPDSERGRVITYIVRRKRTDLPKRQRIPKKVVAYLTTGKAVKRRRHRFVFRTDVVSMPRKAVLTGVRCDDKNEWFTSGALISWGSPNNTCWGFLTVGHGVSGLQASVQISANPAIFGTVVAISSPDDPLDAAIIALFPEDVAASFAIVLPPNPPPAPPRTLEQIIEDGSATHPSGVSLTIDGPKAFLIYAYVQQQDTTMIMVAPTRQHLLLVTGSDNSFNPGTSGSVWMCGQATPDAIQIAGYPTSQIAGQTAVWATGIGQPLVEYLEWAGKQAIVNGQTIQLVATF